MSRYPVPFNVIPVPFALRTGLITQDSIEVGWSVAGSIYYIEGYEVTYAPVDQPGYTLTNFSYVPYITLFGLLPGTQYIINVRSYSQSGFSEPSENFYATTRGPFLTYNKPYAPRLGSPYAPGFYPPSKAW